jgi:hypothetical protein
MRGDALPLLVVFTMAARGLGAQVPSAEQMLALGAHAAAVDSFAARALGEPDRPAHWYHLGVAWFALGSQERARVAWIRAARLAPRHAAIRRALSRTGPADPRSRALLWVSPLTVDEALAAAVALWLIGWTMVVVRRRLRAITACLGIAVLAGAYGTFVAVRYRAPAAIVLDGGTPLREAPYRGAPALERMGAGVAVRIAETRGAWMLVAFGARRGWIASAEAVRL